VFRLAAPIAVAAVVGLAGCGGDDDSGGSSPPPRATTAEQQDAGGSNAREPLRTNGEPRLETAVTSLEAPWEIAFLPDRRALLTERAGRVRLLDRDLKLRDAPAAEVEVAAIGEGGLLGLAVDPQFRRNRFVYLYRTTDSGNEVLRYRFEGDRLTEEAVVLDGLEGAPIHDGGRIHFGPDGLLYVSTGEAGNPDLAQDDDSLNGKFLRVSGFRGSAGRPEVISKGHRNVQGFDWDAEGRLFATEFGDDSDDEVNLIQEGRNYGWPDREGTEGGDGFTPALVGYEDVIAPSGGTIVSQPGSTWTGDFIFGALVGEQIRRMQLDGAKAGDDEALFDGRLGRVRTVVEGPDGALYALTNNTDGRGSPREGDDRLVRIVPPRG
jgi:aldose sugar dehydrogenase